jgi:hypothetical protein
MGSAGMPPRLKVNSIENALTRESPATSSSLWETRRGPSREAVPFWNGSEFPHEIGELLQMPAVAFVILPAVAATLLTRFPAIGKLMA